MSLSCNVLVSLLLLFVTSLILLFRCSSFVGNVERFRRAGTSQTFREIGYQQITLQPDVPNVGTCRGMKHLLYL